MAIDTSGAGTKGRRPSNRGVAYSYVRQGTEVLAKWPKKAGKARMAKQKARNDQFRLVQWAFKYSGADIQSQLAAACKGTPILPRDVFTMNYYGRSSSFIDENGRVYWSMAAVKNISDSLDVVAQLPGDLLLRGPTLWQPIHIGSVGQILTVNASGDAAEWDDLPPYPVVPGVFTPVADGLVPASGGGILKFLRADATWDDPITGIVAELAGGNTFTGNQAVTGNVTVTGNLIVAGDVQPTGLGIILKQTSASAGFRIDDRASAPGHQADFISEAAVTSAGAVLNVYAALSTALAKNTSQISLWTVAPTEPSRVQCTIRGKNGTSGEELVLLTQLGGVAGLVAGDIVFQPNAIEQLRVVVGTGIKVAGTTNSVGNYLLNGIQVVGARNTGWSPDTGITSKAAHATYVAGATLTFSATYVQAELTAMATRMAAVEAALVTATQTIAALKAALTTHGLIGA